jgi:hypothetical protein
VRRECIARRATRAPDAQIATRTTHASHDDDVDAHFARVHVRILLTRNMRVQIA